MSYDYERQDQIQKYQGQPKNASPKNISGWKKFLRIVLPWLTKKWELGNAYLEAKVEKEVNEANKIKAETILLQIQAEKEIQGIIDNAGYKDEANAISIDLTPISEKELSEQAQELSEKLKMLYLKFGLRINISIEQEHSSVTIFELKTSDHTSTDNEKFSPK